MPQTMIGRQPILDRQQQLYAYELLYRHGEDSAAAVFDDGNLASAHTILNAFLNLGIERIAGRRRVFINLTRQLFIEQLPILFEPSQVVLEVLEDIEVDAELVQAVARLHARGFQIAIDDFSFEPKWEPLLPYAHFIKVEIRPDDWQALGAKLPALRRHGALLLAEKVETREQFEQLHAMGFDLFQGFFFARPNLIAARSMSESQHVLMQLLRRINDPAVEIEELSDIISRDPVLSFKVLRAMNSAAYTVGRQVTSIHEAIVYLGLARVCAMATLFIMSGLDKAAVEALNLGLVRAAMCERVVRLTSNERPEQAYTFGLISVLDVLLCRPMHEALKSLPAVFTETIIERTGDFGAALNCAIALERGDWASEHCKILREEVLTQAYMESMRVAAEFVEMLD